MMCHLEDPKMGPFWGPRQPRFDAVFNKTASRTQSLYARARIGIVYSGQNSPNWTHFDPWYNPRSHRTPETAHFGGPKQPQNTPIGTLRLNPYATLDTAHPEPVQTTPIAGPMVKIGFPQPGIIYLHDTHQYTVWMSCPIDIPPIITGSATIPVISCTNTFRL